MAFNDAVPSFIAEGGGETKVERGEKGREGAVRCIYSGAAPTGRVLYHRLRSLYVFT
jgi:hypothetical protein